MEYNNTNFANYLSIVLILLLIFNCYYEKNLSVQKYLPIVRRNQGEIFIVEATPPEILLRRNPDEIHSKSNIGLFFSFKQYVICIKVYKIKTSNNNLDIFKDIRKLIRRNKIEQNLA